MTNDSLSDSSLVNPAETVTPNQEPILSDSVAIPAKFTIRHRNNARRVSSCSYSWTSTAKLWDVILLSKVPNRIVICYVTKLKRNHPQHRITVTRITCFEKVIVGN